MLFHEAYSNFGHDLSLSFFHCAIIRHVSFVHCMTVNYIQLSFSLVLQLRLLRLKHKFKQLRRALLILLNTIREVKLLMHAEFLIELAFFELVDYFLLTVS